MYYLGRTDVSECFIIITNELYGIEWRNMSKKDNDLDVEGVRSLTYDDENKIIK